MADDPYVDDVTIDDASHLWRRIPPWHFVFDDNLGRVRPSSAAFDDHPNGSPMSVLIAADVLSSGRTADSVLQSFSGFAMASFTAGLARSCRQGIARQPLDDEPAHAIVFGRKTDRVKKRLAKESLWLIRPEA